MSYQKLTSFKQYQSMYEYSIRQPDDFWKEQAEHFITWEKNFDKVSDCDLDKGQVRWFEGGQLNACVNCVDRHLPEKANDIAIYFEGNEPGTTKQMTYQTLYESICRMANVMKSKGLKKGDRVCIYMPMIPEAIVSMLACARIGVIHSVVFGGFSPESLRNRRIIM